MALIMNDVKQQTICGYEHLVMIATILQKENLSPERVSEALTDIASIVSIVRCEFENQLKSVIERAVMNNGAISKENNTEL